ncbi:thioredoxin family protein [Christiangramia echinicola]|uniref:Thioredoxin n=1 Tax=Christiangramia echinicola TaxID=279359 RepID=A0A1H1SE26_9FLAO|nr:thioredoxin family protein [Christiangramia echinicola]SDS46237.1 Thioredoxin [Christiangramia echinicola]
MQLTEPVFNYDKFFNWMQELAKTGKTSGDEQTQVLADFTALNRRRMSRLNKTLNLNNELKNALDKISEAQEWVVITEAWCGDSAQCLPMIGKIAAYSEKINLKIVLRFKNPELMEQYLTNGSRSIPKLIALNSKGQELFTWGPRPVPAQELLKNWKKDPAGRNWEAFEMELHTWYSKDKSKTMQQEFIQLLKKYE